MPPRAEGETSAATQTINLWEFQPLVFGGVTRECLELNGCFSKLSYLTNHPVVSLEPLKKKTLTFHEILVV